VTLEFIAGDFCTLRGEPGSGRTLLLRLLGLLERPESGDVLVEGVGTSEFDEPVRDELRNRRFGFIFSAPFLLPSMTVLENIAMPLFRISQLNPEQARARTDLLLNFVGLLEAEQERIDSLSYHAQQCVALARALATEPAVIVAEELDGPILPEERLHFYRLLRSAAERFGVTIIAAVPPTFVEEKIDRVIDIVAGRVLRDTAALRELGT
jgi:lipoprotein-releasing system ATP-binding protein